MSGEPQIDENTVSIAAHEEVGVGRFAEARRRLVPEGSRIERAILEVQHAVILWNEMQPPAGSGHAHQLRDHAAGERDRMQHVPAHGEVERAVGCREFIDALVLERQPGCELLVPLASGRQVRVENVHAEHLGPGIELRQARGRFTGAATRVEDANLGTEPVAPDEFDFLRPNGARLCVQGPHHRLVGHVLGMWIQVRHGVAPVVMTSARAAV